MRGKPFALIITYHSLLWPFLIFSVVMMMMTAMMMMMRQRNTGRSLSLPLDMSAANILLLFHTSFLLYVCLTAFHPRFLI